MLELLPPPPIGIHRNVPDRDYHRMDCLSRSMLDAYHAGDSLAQIRWSMLHPAKPTPPQQLGTAVHMMVLEPERAATEVLQAPALDLRKPADRERWVEFQADHLGAIILRGADDGIDRYDAARYMRDAVLEHPFGRAFLPLVSERELTCVWKLTGEPLIDVTTFASKEPRYRPSTACTLTAARFRIDALVAEDRAILDVKTIYSVNKSVRERRISEGLHRQGAFYRQGARALGLPAEHYVVFFVQSAPPWEVVPQRIPEGDLEIGWNEMQAAWLAADPHVAAGRWPGHTDDLVEEGLPTWYRKRALWDAAL